MKVLFVTNGTDKIPATRYRVTQYLSHLAKRGVEYKEFSVISRNLTSLVLKSPDFEKWSKSLYYTQVLLQRFFRTFWIIANAKKYDIIFLQRATFLSVFYFPILERLLKFINSNIIFDIDDAIYLTDRPKKRIDFKRWIKKTEVANILKVSKIVVVENEHIKKHITDRLGYSGKIVTIPGPIDIERFFVKEKASDTDEVVIGWIGSPGTTPYLRRLDNVLKNIKNKHRSVKFKFIGLGKYENRDIEFERLDWSYETEVENLQTFDIGIMPMPDDEWTRGKLGCKMLQYMACGVPAVVSYTPTNDEIIDDKENGFFVREKNEGTNEKGWIDVLSRLIEDRHLRRKIGKTGRHTVEDRCSLQKNTRRLLEVFKSLENRNEKNI